MKRCHFLISFLSLTLMVFSCRQEPGSQNPEKTISIQTPKDSLPPTKELWADQVESSTNLSLPEDWTKEDFNSIYKNINRSTIYNDIIDAVLSGKQKAYNFFNDSAYSIEQVKAILGKPNRTANDLSLFRVREKVYFDKENFKLERVPNSLILYVNHVADGAFHGYEPLFYVKIR
jgi:hypothetical protein